MTHAANRGLKVLFAADLICFIGKYTFEVWKFTKYYEKGIIWDLYMNFSGEVLVSKKFREFSLNYMIQRFTIFSKLTGRSRCPFQK